MPASIYLRAAGALLLSVAGAAEMQAQCYGCNSTGHSAYIYCDNWSEGGSSYCSWGVDYPGDPSMPEQYWCLQGGTCNASLTDELADGTYHLGSADNPLEEALAGLNDSYNTRPLSLASVALAAANDGGRCEVRRFQEDLEGLMRDYRLSEEEKEAFRSQDLKKMAALGLHPYFLTQVTRLFHGSARNDKNSAAAQAYIKALVEK